MSMRLISRVGNVLVLNGVPLWGVLAAQWPLGVALAIYWFENLFLILLIGLRIVLHRRATRKQGHYNAAITTATITTRARGKTAQRTTRSQGSFLLGFVTVAIPFTLAHGLFLVVILFLALPQLLGAAGQLELHFLRQGLMLAAAILLFDFLLDLRDLREQPFSWIRRLSELYLGRVLVVHLTIIFGMFALALFDNPLGLFVVFATLKTMVELSARLPQYDPAEPPAWLMRIMRYFSSEADFVAYWRQERVAQQQREEQDERVLQGG
jgi:hypothetical protein